MLYTGDKEPTRLGRIEDLKEELNQKYQRGSKPGEVHYYKDIHERAVNGTKWYRKADPDQRRHLYRLKDHVDNSNRIRDIKLGREVNFKNVLPHIQHLSDSEWTRLSGNILFQAQD